MNSVKKFMVVVVTAALGSAALAQNAMPGMKMDMKNTMNGSMGASMSMMSGMAGMNMQSMNSAMSTLAKLNGKAFDRAFLSMMIPHHMAAVAMSKAVLPLTKDDQVKQWANTIIKSQEAEINTMNALLKPLGGANPSLMALMQKGMSGMATMVKKSKNPDMNFVQAMIPHHSSAIDTAKMALEKSNNPQILKLSKDIVVAQAGEMYDFKTWLSKR